MCTDLTHKPVGIERPPGFVWCSNEGKLDMTWKLIPPLDILLHKDPKEDAQGPISLLYLAIYLGMTRSDKLKVSAQLLPKGEPKVAHKLAIPI